MKKVINIMKNPFNMMVARLGRLLLASVLFTFVLSFLSFSKPLFESMSLSINESFNPSQHKTYPVFFHKERMNIYNKYMTGAINFNIDTVYFVHTRTFTRISNIWNRRDTILVNDYGIRPFDSMKIEKKLYLAKRFVQDIIDWDTSKMVNLSHLAPSYTKWEPLYISRVIFRNQQFEIQSIKLNNYADGED